MITDVGVYALTLKAADANMASISISYSMTLTVQYICTATTLQVKAANNIFTLSHTLVVKGDGSAETSTYQHGEYENVQ